VPFVSSFGVTSNLGQLTDTDMLSYSLQYFEQRVIVGFRAKIIQLFQTNCASALPGFIFPGPWGARNSCGPPPLYREAVQPVHESNAILANPRG
jgi:hypothetical protein